jgi:hypothetical protein
MLDSKALPRGLALGAAMELVGLIIFGTGGKEDRQEFATLALEEPPIMIDYAMECPDKRDGDHHV